MTARGWIFLGLAFLAGLALFGFEASGHVDAALWSKLLSATPPLSLDELILAYSVLPRAGVALVAGAMLGLSGALLQQLLRNPIADPSTLGISSGAQLAIVAATLYAPEVVDGHRTAVALRRSSLRSGGATPSIQ